MQLEEAPRSPTDCLEDGPWHGVERFLYEMAERSADHGVSDATKERCMAARPWRRSAAASSTSRPRSSGAPRRAAPSATTSPARTWPDVGRASSTASVPFPGLRADLWKRYLGIVLDGLRPAGATKLRPGPAAQADRSRDCYD